MSYSFRIRFTRSHNTSIEHPAAELPLSSKALGYSITLRSGAAGLPIRTAETLSVVGKEFNCPENASAAAKTVHNALMVALARLRIGADFGSRAPKAFCTSYGLNLIEQQLGVTALNDVHGTMVFPSTPDPRFVRIKPPQLIYGVNPKTLTEAFNAAISQKFPLDAHDELAYTLYNASFFQPNSDSRFLLLIMAIEAITKPQKRSPAVIDHIKSLISQTRSSGIPSHERAALASAINALCKESVGQAARRLVHERLGDIRYNDLSALDFFKHCYRLRSRLVHGDSPPAYELIVNSSASLEVFVSDLLTAPVLGFRT